MKNKIHPYTFAGMRPALQNQRDFNVQQLFMVIAELYGVTFEDLKSQSRVRAFVELRRISMYLLHKKFEMTSGSVGKMFNRDHATVLHHCKQVDDLYEFDPKFREMFTKILNRLNGQVVKDKGYVVGDVAPRIKLR
jgi:chromosomal replication initiator protein